jgi:hypothetical protein
VFYRIGDRLNFKLDLAHQQVHALGIRVDARGIVVIGPAARCL